MLGVFNPPITWVSFSPLMESNHFQKIEAISRIDRPTSITHVQSIVGLINYYKDMWPRHAHMLSPLPELCSSKRKFKWTDAHENSFNQAKRLISEDVLLRFPDHSIPFEIYTDACNLQIGATMKQRNLPVAYFSKKLTPTQRHYSTIEQEMLAIVEVLKEYKKLLLGTNITIFTDHKNLLSNSTVNDRVFRWKQKIQEFGPTLNYIKGHKNIEADTLSQLPITDESIEVMLNHPPIDLYNLL